MRATCPDCGTDGHIAAFFAEADGKRLAASLAAMPPDLGRAVIGYLGLFKPAKTGLRMPRAIKLVDELRALVDAGTVCNDERSGVRRPCTAATWAAGIEQLLVQRGTLTLPLANHNYLRAVVFGLADKADAASERQKEADARVGKHLKPASGNAVNESPVQAQLTWIDQMADRGGFTPEEAEIERGKAHAKYGSAG